MRAGLAAGFAAVALLAAGCTAEHGVTVAYGAGSARVPVGEPVRVDLGPVNPSIGDSWYLTGGPDPTVLTSQGQDLTSGCLAGEAGCGGHLYWRFHAIARGRTMLRFQYCYRSAPAQCDPGPGRGPTAPVTLDVTVI